MNKDSKIYIAGHRGMVGSAIKRLLEAYGYSNIVYKKRAGLDLLNQASVNSFFEQEKPEYVFLAAAKVGGIHANNEYPADFIYQNLMIQNNIIHASYMNVVKRLLFLGSSCIYPRLASQPMKEEELLSSTLEPTNEPYAVAKIAGIKTCESYNRQYGTDYRSIMPTNLYGPNDNYHPENSHVIPALIRKFHEAKISDYDTVEVWGSGKVYREFLYVDDMAAASIHIMNVTKEDYRLKVDERCSHINVGTGHDVTIKELAEMVKDTVGFKGQIYWNVNKPDGTPKKLLNVSKLLTLGFEPKESLKTGLQKAYKDFQKR
ncbi:MAG: GDP-L-fucose synthase [Lentisphaeraceae bacterium]|nr:GDP-L-fucose synthase [Lentisphaeraceae bacterium]